MPPQVVQRLQLIFLARTLSAWEESARPAWGLPIFLGPNDQVTVLVMYSHEGSGRGFNIGSTKVSGCWRRKDSGGTKASSGTGRPACFRRSLNLRPCILSLLRERHLYTSSATRCAVSLLVDTATVVPRRRASGEGGGGTGRLPLGVEHRT